MAEERVGTTSDVVILDAQDFALDPMPIAGVVEHASHGVGFLSTAALLIAALGGLVLVERRWARTSYRDRQRAVSTSRTEA